MLNILWNNHTIEYYTGKDKEQTTDMHIDMDESNDHNVEWRKPDRKECTMHDSISMMFKNR